MSNPNETPSRGFKVVGSRPVRPDAVDKVTGRAQFGADIFLPGMLHGRVLRSPHAHALINGIDVSAAAAYPGVKAVITARDFPYLDPYGAGAMARENLAREKVLYHGHSLVALAATSPSIAEEAMQLIKVNYTVLPSVMDLDSAMAGSAPILHEHLFAPGADKEHDAPSNIYAREEIIKGDVEAGFADADVIVEGDYSTPTVHQGYIEPPACVAEFKDGATSTIWTTTQGHFTIRALVARMLSMDLSMLKVVPTEIGGGFGGKTTPYQEAIALLLAKKSGRPVKFVMSREDVFRSAGPGSAFKGHYRIGARNDGSLTAFEAKIYYDSGAFPGAPLGGGMRSICTAYRIPNVHVEGFAVVTNKPMVRAYRGPGAPQATLGTECLLNELATQLAMDPIELRLSNAVRQGDEGPAGPFTEIGFIECLQAARNSEHYRSTLSPGQGRGVAAGFWQNGGNESSAEIYMNTDGTAVVSSGSADLSGTRISLAMMAAEELGVPIEKVTAQVADTDSIGFTSTSGGSRTINATGQAVIAAVRDAIEQMKQRAASGWNIPVEQVEWRNGCAVNGVQLDELSVKQICRSAGQTGGPITGRSSLNVKPGLGPSFAVHLCDVEVDAETGQTRVKRYTVVQDAGCAIHPDYVEGQLQGGASQGIGWALNEEYIWDENGRLDNAGFLDYRIPLASDLPMIDTIVIEVPNKSHPYGVRGVGESPVIPPLAAVTSAVSNAIGTRICDLPCSPARVLAALMAGKTG